MMEIDDGFCKIFSVSARRRRFPHLHPIGNSRPSIGYGGQGPSHCLEFGLFGNLDTTHYYRAP